MSKLNKVSAFVFSILATVFISGAASASTVSEKQNATQETATASIELSVQCASPTNRDYHNVLSAYNSDTEGQYKFSGCGGVL